MSNKKLIAINMPDLSGRNNTALTRFRHARKDYILFIDIEQDTDPTSPKEHADEHAFLVYGHREFTVNAPKELNEVSALEIHSAKDKWEESHHVYPVYAYIHSGVYLKLNTDAGLPDRQWDVSMCGYCLVTRDEKEIPQPLKYAEGMIEEWNQYLSGDVWGYDMALYPLQKDEDGEPVEERDYYERHGKAVYEDSCWGFYGSDYALEETKHQAECYVAGLRRKAA